MRIVVDAFGGDNAPLEVLKGAIRANKELGVDITLVGDEVRLKSAPMKTGLIFRKCAFIMLRTSWRFHVSLIKYSRSIKTAQWLSA